MKAGIYAIEHLPSGRVYIGQSIHAHRRLSAHRSNLRQRVHHNPPLQKCYDKYGDGEFLFHVIQLCEVCDLTELENRWVALFREFGCVFNIREACDSNSGHKLTEETKRKIGASNTGKKRSEEARRKMSEACKGRTPPNKGKPISEELRKKLSLAKLGKKYGPRSEEWRKNISLSQKGKPRKPASEETRIRMSESQKARWRDRKAA